MTKIGIRIGTTDRYHIKLKNLYYALTVRRLLWTVFFIHGYEARHDMWFHWFSFKKGGTCIKKDDARPGVISANYQCKDKETHHGIALLIIR